MDLFLTIAPLKWGAIFTVLTCGAVIGVTSAASPPPVLCTTGFAQAKATMPRRKEGRHP
jgi:hypothetical protein